MKSFTKLLLFAAFSLLMVAGCKSKNDLIVEQVLRKLEDETIRLEKRTKTDGKPPVDDGKPPVDDGKPPVDNGKPPVEFVVDIQVVTKQAMSAFDNVELTQDQLGKAERMTLLRDAQLRELFRERGTLLSPRIQAARAKAYQEANAAGKEGAELDATVAQAIGEEIFARLAYIQEQLDIVVSELRLEIKQLLTPEQRSKMENGKEKSRKGEDPQAKGG